MPADFPPRRLSWRSAGPWRLVFLGWIPDEERTREALCTLANGNVGMRGAAEEHGAGGPHAPGTYLAGGYERIEAWVAGRHIEHDALVNWPNPLAISFRPQGGRWLDPGSMDVRDYSMTLDLRRGVLQRRLRVRDEAGRETSLISERLVHMARPQLACLWWTLVPESWSGVMELRAGIDAHVTNTGVAYYGQPRGLSVAVRGHGTAAHDCIYLIAQTQATGLRLVQAVQTRVHGSAQDENQNTQEQNRNDPRQHDGQEPSQHLRIACARGRAVRVDKRIALVSSRDRAVRCPEQHAIALVQSAGDTAALRRSHERAWSRLWDRCDIHVRAAADPAVQILLRLHIFHLLQTVTVHGADLDAGIPARGLSGEAYHGHVFWDDLFVFPFFDLRLPELSRALLLYRYRRLPAARRLAAEAGYRGAMFPWRSAVEGTEETPALQYNRRADTWLPDHTNLQRHINAAIVYNTWHYYQASGDSAFLSCYGAELILEIARLWSSMAQMNPASGRYEIHGVVGPDEFHTRYPGAPAPGLANNAYTNVMAVWTLRCAERVLALLPAHRRRALCAALDIDARERARWRHITRAMRVPFHGDGILSQFDGYDTLREIDLDAYHRRYGNIQRIDRILQAEGDTPDRYQVSKQADALMLFYLLPAPVLRRILGDLGYPFAGADIARNVRYYGARTTHGSTLSRVVFSWVLARQDRPRSWEVFRAALRSDIDDIQGGTTGDGLHIGAMAGTVDLVQRCYMGIELRNDTMHLSPRIPDAMEELRMPVCFRGAWIDLCVTGKELRVCMREGWPERVRIAFRGRPCELARGQTRRFLLRDQRMK